MAAVEGGGVEEPDLPPVRPDLVELTGYHSPQVEVEVRLNTNESPLPPPDGWLEELRAGLGAHRLQPIPRPGGRRARPRSGRDPRVRPEPGVLCQRLERGPPVPAAGLRRPGPHRGPVRADLHPAPPHRLGHRHHRGCRAPRPTTTASTSTRCDRVTTRPSSRSSPSCARPTIPPAGPTRPSSRRRCPGAGPGPHGGGRGLRPVRPVVGPRTHPRPADRGSQRLVVVRTFSKTWSMAGVRLGYLVADPDVVRACELVALPYHLDA